MCFLVTFCISSYKCLPHPLGLFLWTLSAIPKAKNCWKAGMQINALALVSTMWMTGLTLQNAYCTRTLNIHATSSICCVLALEPGCFYTGPYFIRDWLPHVQANYVYCLTSIEYLNDHLLLFTAPFLVPLLKDKSPFLNVTPLNSWSYPSWNLQRVGLIRPYTLTRTANSWRRVSREEIAGYPAIGRWTLLK